MNSQHFRTVLTPADFPDKISHESKIVSVGSCFANNMSEKLSYFKFNITVQPYGILYNPLIIAHNLQNTINGFSDFEPYLQFQNDLCHSLLHHGSFSNPDKAQLLNNIQESELKNRAALKEADLQIITLGTAFTYFYKKEDFAVANCHKIPAAEFDRRLISSEQIFDKMNALFLSLKKLNPKLKILLSVSPVRHLKDGFQQNQLSKAHLLLACEKLRKVHSNVSYFPAYEMMMDDLRDYRFYAEDLLHPNATAIQYIWEKWANAFLKKETLLLLKEIDAIQKGLKHRPIHSIPLQEKTLAEKLLNKISAIGQKESAIDFSGEKEALNQRYTKP